MSHTFEAGCWSWLLKLSDTHQTIQTIGRLLLKPKRTILFQAWATFDLLALYRIALCMTSLIEKYKTASFKVKLWDLALIFWLSRMGKWYSRECFGIISEFRVMRIDTNLKESFGIIYLFNRYYPVKEPEYRIVSFYIKYPRYMGVFILWCFSVLSCLLSKSCYLTLFSWTLVCSSNNWMITILGKPFPVVPGPNSLLISIMLIFQPDSMI